MESKEKWIRDGKTIYSLHESGRYVKGEPELCNKFYFGVQPDYARGITDAMAEEQAERVCKAVNNYDEMVAMLTELRNNIRFDIHTPQASTDARISALLNKLNP